MKLNFSTSFQFSGLSGLMMQNWRGTFFPVRNITQTHVSWTALLAMHAKMYVGLDRRLCRQGTVRLVSKSGFLFTTFLVCSTRKKSFSAITLLAPTQQNYWSYLKPGLDAEHATCRILPWHSYVLAGLSTGARNWLSCCCWPNDLGFYFLFIYCFLVVVLIQNKRYTGKEWQND